jgi:hypothetical protein
MGVLNLFLKVVILVRNPPHAPSMLFVGVVPHKHVGEGSAHEFGSNPPFKKKHPTIFIS